jgi:syntaxin-binding protein 1
MGDFNQFVEQSGAFSTSLVYFYRPLAAANGIIDRSGASSLNDIKDMLADLPQYQQQREMFSLHLNMAQQCMDLFEQRKLTLVANVEQNASTGLTAEGKTPKTLVEDMVPLLGDSTIT